MKQILLVFCLMFCSVKMFGQQFSQYNTGTLYDSFENPSQRVFTPDTSLKFASNFLVPNLNANIYLTGNAQASVRTRLFSNYYNDYAIQVGNGKLNHFVANAGVYSVMLKMYASLNGDQELGFFIKTNGEARALATDESVAILNGITKFPNNSYSNVFNDNYFLQLYQQVGFTYREQVTKQFAIGFKLSALSGIDYKKVTIDQSQINFDKVNDLAVLSLQGTAYTGSANNADGSKTSALASNGLTFRNPGAAISIGSSYTTRDGYKLQFNVKDLGFIHWNKTSNITSFSEDTAVIRNLSSNKSEKNTLDQLGGITKGTALSNYSSFNSAIDGMAELSVNKSFWINDNRDLKFSPTLIASKELFYTGFTAALVTPVQYQKYVFSLTSSYNDLNLFNLGAQFMIKTFNGEFFIGSESLIQTGSIIHSAIQGQKNTADMIQYIPGSSPFTGGSFFMGFAMKFGPVIEHPMNASYIPVNEEKGFFGRLLERIFPSDPIKNN